MKTVLVVLGSIFVTGIFMVAWLTDVPKPATALPNPKYSGPAISTDTVRLVQDYTVLISNESMEGMSRGTGILLSSTTVLTCAHMIPADKSLKNMWIYPYPEAQVVHAKLKFINYPKDLALLELSTPIVGHKAPVFADSVETGEPIVVVGNIQGYMMWFVSYGIISGEHSRWVLTDAAIRGGNSGGPWANTKGEVVALTDVGWNDRNGQSVGISGGVPSKDLQDFLKNAGLKKPSIIYALTGE